MTDTKIRNKLSLERTLMANERTLLSYVRTALTILAVGVGLLEFVDSQGTNILGWGLITAALTLVPIGVLRYLSVRKYIRKPLDP